MKNLLVVLILCNCLNAQNKKALKNHFDQKIQFFGGALPALYIDPFSGSSLFYADSYHVGLEASHNFHNAGLYFTEGNCYLQRKSRNLQVHSKFVCYYGWRISRKYVSTSLNVGVGRAELKKWVTEEVPLHPSSLTYEVRTLRTFASPCFEVLVKSNLTKKANGLGLILSANFNTIKVFLDARLVLQFGYDWNSKNKNGQQNLN